MKEKFVVEFKIAGNTIRKRTVKAEDEIEAEEKALDWFYNQDINVDVDVTNISGRVKVGNKSIDLSAILETNYEELMEEIERAIADVIAERLEELLEVDVKLPDEVICCR